MMATSVDFDSVSSTAAEHAACPICLEDLVSRADEVGALTQSGQRVEAALYHRRCVGIVATGGIPRLPGGCSPTSRAPVDGFTLMPPIRERRRWLKFVDWNGDGQISVSELSGAVAAMLPVDETRLESYVRKHFAANGDVIPEADLESKVLPHLEIHLADLAVTAPLVSAPTLTRSSGRSELLAWFKHWDADDSGSLDAEELRFALATLFFRALGDADLTTKRAVVEAFLAEPGLRLDSGVSKTAFIERLVPALQANLPLPETMLKGDAGDDPADAGTEIGCTTKVNNDEDADVATDGSVGASTGSTESVPLRLRLLLATTGASVEAQFPDMGVASLGDLRCVAIDRLADANAKIGMTAELFVAGRRLEGPDAMRLRQVPQLRSGVAVQVLLRAAADEIERLRRLREEVAREHEQLRRERETHWQEPRSSIPPGVSRPEPTGRLTPGERVRIVGLRGTTTLNGRLALLLRYEEGSGRYVVEVEGDGQKSLRPENLERASAAAAEAGGWNRKIRDAGMRGVARVQLWCADYEWWQLLLFGACFALFIALVMGQIRGSNTEGLQHDRGAYRRTGDRGRGTQDQSRGRERSGGTHRGHRNAHRPRHDYGTGDYGESSEFSEGLVGGNGPFGQSTVYIVLAGIGFLCWKGIIPIHQMDFWQIMMLWNLVEPWLFGGRRRNRGFGGFGGFGGGFGGFGGMGGGLFHRRGFF
eukprot:TRINITY_DN24323_c0_g1_i1.p1 TRINITY_DN24323_c0_g1~~TRINITY_DN24323_c0_g1_i1.p1  ORF type:complete len:706 (+),score=108.18 TRINITY_DN24323_c0_g1_i1:171-2288(+)